MRVPGTAPLRRLIDRLNRWFWTHEPITYRDAWRYSLMFAAILLPQAVAHFAVGNAIWPALLALVVPAMAAFTFGFAVRAGTVRQRLLSLGVGLAGGAIPLALPSVRGVVVAVGAPGILLLWLLGLLCLLGYAFPEYGPAVMYPDDGGAADESGS